MTKDEKIQHLTHIAYEISEVEAEVEETTYDEFISKEQIRESVYSHLQMMGKAAHLLSMKTGKEEMNFDPKLLSNFRNIRYKRKTEIDHANIWYIITHDLIRLKDTVNWEAAKINTP